MVGKDVTTKVEGYLEEWKENGGRGSWTEVGVDGQ